MAAGTKYEVKNELLNAIVSRVFTNKTFEVSAAGLQLNYCDIIESLWDRAGSAVTVDTYSDFLELVTNSELSPGQVYSVPYRCVHQIPGTSVNNIDSPQYVNKVETFIVKAISSNQIFPWVKSIDHPNDLILWDISNNTSENFSTSRSGKVLYREDKINKLSTYYDFRGVYFRRGVLDLESTIPVWETGQNWNKGSFALFGGILKRAVINMSPDNVGDSLRWQEISPGGNLRWIWGDGVSYLGNNVPRTNVQDFLTFQNNSLNVHIGLTPLNFGYNNIVFVNCQNVKVGDNSFDSHFNSCNNIEISGSISSSLVGSSNRVSSDIVTGAYIWSCNDFKAVDLGNDAVFNCSSLSIGATSESNNFTTIRRSSIGQEFRNNTVQYMIDSSVGVSATGNLFRNIESCEINNSVINNNFAGLKWCTVMSNVNSCTFNTATNQYAVYKYVTIHENCNNLSASPSANVERVTFHQGCFNVSVDSGNIINSVFGARCNNFTITSGGSILDSTIGAESSNFTINTGSTINKADISSRANNFTLINNSSLQECKIGPRALNWELGTNGSAQVTGVLFGSNFSGLVLDSSTVSFSWFGENISGTSIVQASNVISCHFENSISGLNINSASTLLGTNVGQVANLQVSGATVINTNILQGANNVTIHQGAQLSNCIIPSGFVAKTITGNINPTYSKVNFNDQNDTGLTIDNDTTLPKSKRYRTITPIGAFSAVNIDLRGETAQGFVLSNSQETTVNITGTSGNVDIEFLVTNSDVVARDFIFNNTQGVPTFVTVSIPDGETHFIKVKRVLGGPVDKLVLVESYQI